MATTRTAVAPHAFAFTKSPAAPATPGFWSRVFTAMTAARMRQAEREVARYLSETGGKFTDEAEREIERRFLSNHSHF